MDIYYVWDELNGCRKTAQEIKADSFENAAILFAEQDCDGLSDGLYTNNGMPLRNLERQGHPVMVDDLQTTHRIRVGIVEFEPVYGAVRTAVMGVEVK